MLPADRFTVRPSGAKAVAEGSVQGLAERLAVEHGQRRVVLECDLAHRRPLVRLRAIAHHEPATCLADLAVGQDDLDEDRGGRGRRRFAAVDHADRQAEEPYSPSASGARVAGQRTFARDPHEHPGLGQVGRIDQVGRRRRIEGFDEPGGQGDLVIFITLPAWAAIVSNGTLLQTFHMTDWATPRLVPIKARLRNDLRTRTSAAVVVHVHEPEGVFGGGRREAEVEADGRDGQLRRLGGGDRHRGAGRCVVNRNRVEPFGTAAAELAEAPGPAGDRTQAHALEPAPSAALTGGAGGDQAGREDDVESLGTGVADCQVDPLLALAPSGHVEVARLAGLEEVDCLGDDLRGRGGFLGSAGPLVWAGAREAPKVRRPVTRPAADQARTRQRCRHSIA